MKHILALGLSLLLFSRAHGELIGRWMGDGDALDTVNTNHGTLKNGATYAAGRTNLAFSLDGANDYVALPDATSKLVSNGSGTITAWVYPTTVAGNDVVIAFGSGANGQGIGLGIWGKVYIYHHTGLYDWGTSTPVSPNQWTFLAYTWDASTESIYTNGYFSESRPRGAGSFNYVSGNARIGDGFWGGGNFYPGKISQIMVFNETLSADEIAALASPRPTTINAVYLSGSAPTLNITNITEGLDNSIMRTTDLSLGNWTNLTAFVGRSISSNWTDTAAPNARAFYRIETK
ncbi:MAG: LamG domain-containing protein [Kiritimatiellae bacterium]|nr:LamG domain-containing protein [Kiritimatiellia bacterium]